MKVWIVAVLMLLIACTQQVPVPNVPHQTPTSSERPYIPRTTGTPEVQDAGEQPRETPLPPSPVQMPSVDLDVPVGSMIGQYYPLITRNQFPLLKHPTIRVDRNMIIGYEETLNFNFGGESTGTVIFGQDEVDKSVGTFLRFEDRKPILEYAVRLDRGRFSDIQGRDITILGHTYTIAEANDFSVTLFGKTVASNIVFTNDQPLYVNNSERSGTVVHVRNNSIGFELFAEGRDRGDIVLSPGESLVENIGHMKLASDLFDIRYKGAPLQNATQVALRRSAYGYNLLASLRTGVAEIPLVEQDAGKLVLGRTTDKLHITPCANYCIAPEDNMLFTTPDGKTFMLRYGGASENPKLLNFYDPAGNHYQYEFVGTPGLDAKANIVLEKFLFPVKIGPKTKSSGLYNLSINQGFRNGRVEIVAVDGTIIRIGDIANNTLPIDIIIPGTRTLNKKNATTTLTLAYTGEWHVTTNATFVQEQNTSKTFAQTPNMLIEFKRADRNLPLNIGDDALLYISSTPIYGIVSLEG